MAMWTIGLRYATHYVRWPAEGRGAGHEKSARARHTAGPIAEWRGHRLVSKVTNQHFVLRPL